MTRFEKKGKGSTAAATDFLYLPSRLYDALTTSLSTLLGPWAWDASHPDPWLLFTDRVLQGYALTLPAAKMLMLR